MNGGGNFSSVVVKAPLLRHHMRMGGYPSPYKINSPSFASFFIYREKYPELLPCWANITEKNARREEDEENVVDCSLYAAGF
ncbi:MAG: hypothetical protein Q3M30_14240 [Candidatus Electrothrix sp. Rat3]|nr:hypothetical protein [Candidatus Electrothrix rattekaaiensis]